jgi:hypothetical protein
MVFDNYKVDDAYKMKELFNNKTNNKMCLCLCFNFSFFLFTWAFDCVCLGI